MKLTQNRFRSASLWLTPFRLTYDRLRIATPLTDEIVQNQSQRYRNSARYPKKASVGRRVTFDVL